MHVIDVQMSMQVGVVLVNSSESRITTLRANAEVELAISVRVTKRFRKLNKKEQLKWLKGTNN